jgi:hypothetical protein
MTDEITELPTKLNALPDDTRADKRESLKARKVFAAVFSPFVRAMHECMNAYRDARAQGLERADAAKGIEHVLREMWPKPASKFGPTCQACGDTGYEEYVCRQWARCERHSCQRKGDDWQHTYVRVCECVKGQGFARAAMRKTQPDTTETIGKVTKPKRGFSRMGQ